MVFKVKLSLFTRLCKKRKSTLETEWRSLIGSERPLLSPDPGFICFLFLWKMGWYGGKKKIRTMVKSTSVICEKKGASLSLTFVSKAQPMVSL